MEGYKWDELNTMYETNQEQYTNHQESKNNASMDYESMGYGIIDKKSNSNVQESLNTSHGHRFNNYKQDNEGFGFVEDGSYSEVNAENGYENSSESDIEINVDDYMDNSTSSETSNNENSDDGSDDIRRAECLFKINKSKQELMNGNFYVRTNKQKNFNHGNNEQNYVSGKPIQGNQIYNNSDHNNSYFEIIEQRREMEKFQKLLDNFLMNPCDEFIVNNIQINELPYEMRTLLTIKKLSITSCGLKNLNNLPPNVERLDVGYNNINRLIKDDIPESLTEIIAIHNHIYLIDLKTCNNIKILNVSNNPLNLIAGFPQNINKLFACTSSLNTVEHIEELKKLTCLKINTTDIDNIDKLPDNIEELDISRILLTKNNGLINKLPQNLKILKASMSGICKFNFESFPYTLDELDISDNQIIELPKLPNAMVNIDISNNRLIAVSNIPYRLKIYNCENNPQLVFTYAQKNIIMILKKNYNAIITMDDDNVKKFSNNPHYRVQNNLTSHEHDHEHEDAHEHEKKNMHEQENENDNQQELYNYGQGHYNGYENTKEISLNRDTRNNQRDLREKREKMMQKEKELRYRQAIIDHQRRQNCRDSNNERKINHPIAPNPHRQSFGNWYGQPIDDHDHMNTGTEERVMTNPSNHNRFSVFSQNIMSAMARNNNQGSNMNNQPSMPEHILKLIASDNFNPTKDYQRKIKHQFEYEI